MRSRLAIFPAIMGADTDGNAAVSFKAVIELEGVNPFVRVRADRAARLRPGWRKPMPVLARINGLPAKAWRIHLVPKGSGLFFLYLHGRVRADSGTGVGDRVTVEIAFNAAYKPGPAPLPAWLRTAFRERPAAYAGYKALPPGRQKELVKNLVRLKSTEARARNLDMALRVLSGEKARFMARDWSGGK